MPMMCPKCYLAYGSSVAVCPTCHDRLVWVDNVAGEARYTGFGGWLIVFAIAVVLIFPVIAAIGILSGFRISGRLFAYYPGTLAVFMIDSACKIVLTIWGFYVVYALVRLRPFAGETANKYLIGRAVYTGLSIVFPFIATIPAVATAVFTGVAIFTAAPSVVFIVIWYIYFKKSRRVEATYGRPELGGAWLT
jgi:hypothetical protein